MRRLLHLLRHEWQPIRAVNPKDRWLIAAGFHKRCTFPGCNRLD